jgi:hypothetical protein
VRKKCAGEGTEEAAALQAVRNLSDCSNKPRSKNEKGVKTAKYDMEPDEKMTLEQRFEAWERMIRSRRWRRRLTEEGVEWPSGAEWNSVEKIEEKFAQQYVEEEYRRLGFTKVTGPFSKGPDFQVMMKRRWLWAEVETRWQNYKNHGHHLQKSFSNVVYLILLSPEEPRWEKRKELERMGHLPPQIIHIDRSHFLDWFKVKVSKLQAPINMQIDFVAGAMQDHWVTICSDKDREMAACPDCDNCAYFGEGMFNEANPFFRGLAARFIASHAIDSRGADLRKIEGATLKRFVEGNPPL